MRTSATRTLTRRALLRLGLGGTLILLLASAASTWVLFRQAEAHASERLGVLSRVIISPVGVILCSVRGRSWSIWQATA